jgi:hypothetical protein
MRWLLVFGLVAAGCGGKLGDAQHGVDGAVDPSVDAPEQVLPDGALPPDAATCANGRVVFLDFDGVNLTRAGASDATTNKASWMQIAAATVPPYHSGSANRAAEIQAIVDGVRAELASFPITVVTTRPATGPYVMIVYGGTNSQAGSRFSVAVQTLDCGDAVKSDVAWVGDGVAPAQHVINVSVGAIGFGLGLTATATTTDCMCGWDNLCASNNNAPCTLSPMIARDPQANQQCAGLSTQDEPAAFRAAFCQ